MLILSYLNLQGYFNTLIPRDRKLMRTSEYIGSSIIELGDNHVKEIN